MISEIQIYVACLAAYNNGILHGEWIDATQSFGEMKDAVKSMLVASPIEDAEEYAIHDHEGFEGCSIGEFSSLETVHEFASFIEEHGEIAHDLLAHFSGCTEEASKALEDSYLGEYDSVEDYARELTESCYTIPNNLEFYIDYEAMARDMEMSGDIFTIGSGNGIAVFCNH